MLVLVVYLVKCSGVKESVSCQIAACIAEFLPLRDTANHKPNVTDPNHETVTDWASFTSSYHNAYSTLAEITHAQ